MKITLNNNTCIPAVGLGCWSLSIHDILFALKKGYRLFDTAAQYKNENEVGTAIKEYGIPREEVYITTKLWTDDVRANNVENALKKSLKNLSVDYVDLYLIHWPAEGFEKSWLEMEKLYKQGLIRAIGVSNFNIAHFETLNKAGATVIPAVNQIEIHPLFQNKETVDYCKSKGIICQAWSPLGGPQTNDRENSTIKEIARHHNKTTSQIILKWHLQTGKTVIPRSANQTRIIENLDIFNFSLSDKELQAISKLDKNQRIGPDPNKFDF